MKDFLRKNYDLETVNTSQDSYSVYQAFFQGPDERETNKGSPKKAPAKIDGYEAPSKMIAPNY